MGYFSVVGENIGGQVARRKEKIPKSEVGWGL